MAQPAPPAVERAKRDYLAVSRAKDLYADRDAYERAEADAWHKLQEAVALWDKVRQAV